MQEMKSKPIDPERQEERARSGRRDLQKGSVVRVDGDDIFVDLGPRMQGVITRAQFGEEPVVGQTYEFTLHGMKDDLWQLSRKEAMVLAAWDEIEPGRIVKAVVSGKNEGGLDLKIGPLTAFMPASHVDVKHVEDLTQLFGETLICKVMEVDRGKRRVTLSRREVLLAEREQSLKDVLGSLVPGKVVRGKVTRLEGFGAFVELAPGVEGLVHVSNLSRKRVQNAGDVLSVGQEVEAQVLEIKEGGRRIGLGIKQLERNPWEDLDRRLAIGTVVEGTVTRTMDFGAFVEVEAGVEGLVHVSELDTERVTRVSDVVKPGQKIPVRVLSIDPERERMSLSRLDQRGAILGSDEAVDAAEIDQMLRANQEPTRGTNLGNLFKKAFEGRGE